MLICHKQPAFNIGIAIFGLFVVLCSLWAIVTFFRAFKQHQLEKSSSKIQINPLILHTCIVAAILEILCLIGVFGISWSCLSDSSNWYNISTGVHLWSYGLLCTLVIGICDVRLYTVFQTTIYAYPNYVFCCLGIAFCLTVGGCFILPFLWIVGSDLISPLLTIGAVSFLVQSITTLILFIRGLFKVKCWDTF